MLVRPKVWRGLQPLPGLNEPEQAAKLLGAVIAVSEDYHTPLSSDTRNKITPAIEAMRVTLGEARYEVAWAKGRSLTFEQAIDLALAQTPVEVE
jgi:hypothetical protein